MSSIHVVFALQATTASDAVSRAYQGLSRRIIVALLEEERRSAFLNREVKLLASCHDVSSPDHASDSRAPADALDLGTQLSRSALARSLRNIFEQASSGDGVVDDCSWSLLTYCILPRVHGDGALTEERVRARLTNIMPYHTILLDDTSPGAADGLVRLARAAPMDASPTIERFAQVLSPLKTFERMACDADLSLRQFVELACHFVYWGRAMIVSPVCESNRYIVTPEGELQVDSLVAMQ